MRIIWSFCQIRLTNDFLCIDLKVGLKKYHTSIFEDMEQGPPGFTLNCEQCVHVRRGKI